MDRMIAGRRVSDEFDQAILGIVERPEIVRYPIEPDFLKAIAAIESNTDARAWRFESRWMERLGEARLMARYSEGVERACLAFSWGPCQVLGLVMVELGLVFARDWREIDEPYTSYYYAARQCGRIMRAVGFRGWRDVAARYNGGIGNPQWGYGDHAMRIYSALGEGQ